MSDLEKLKAQREKLGRIYHDLTQLRESVLDEHREVNRQISVLLRNSKQGCPHKRYHKTFHMGGGVKMWKCDDCGKTEHY